MLYEAAELARSFETLRLQQIRVSEIYVEASNWTEFLKRVGGDPMIKPHPERAGNMDLIEKVLIFTGQSRLENEERPRPFKDKSIHSVKNLGGFG